jgi:hypothetical protein
MMTGLLGCGNHTLRVSTTRREARIGDSSSELPAGKGSNLAISAYPTYVAGAWIRMPVRMVCASHRYVWGLPESPGWTVMAISQLGAVSPSLPACWLCQGKSAPL